MKPIFESRRYTLVSVIRTGKKQTPGRLIFVGSPSRRDNGHTLTSPVNGVVLESRRETNPHLRAHRLKSFITIATSDGVQVRFSQLSARIVRKGDTVVEGQVIGFAGDNGVTVDCIRNDRMVDALAHLGIEPGVREFEFEKLTDEDVVALTCGISPGMRDYINRRPGADEFWRSVAAKLRED